VRALRSVTLVLLAVSLVFGTPAWAAKKRPRFLFGFQAGAWKPSALGTEGTLSPRPLPGTGHLWGVAFSSTLSSDLYLLAYVQQWQQYQPDPRSGVSRVRIVPVGLSFRHQLSDVSWIAPFADYGGVLLLGYARDRACAHWRRETGFGASLGAGVEFFFGRRFLVVARAGFLYAKFPSAVGETDDYSGPVLSVSAFLAPW